MIKGLIVYNCQNKLQKQKKTFSVHYIIQNKCLYLQRERKNPQNIAIQNNGNQQVEDKWQLSLSEIRQNQANTEKVVVILKSMTL